MWLNDISIPRKLSLAFGLILFSVAVSSGILFNAARNRDAAAEIARAANRQEVAALNAMAAHIDMAQTMRGYLLTGVERHKRLYGEAVGKFAESIKKAISPELSSLNTKSAEALGKFQQASNQWRSEIAEPIMKLAGNADTREQALNIAMSPRSSELQQVFRDAQLAAFETIRIWAEATAVIEDSAALTADISLQGLQDRFWSAMYCGRQRNPSHLSCVLKKILPAAKALIALQEMHGRNYLVQYQER